MRTDLNISMDRLAKLHGRDAARRTQQATYDAVDEVGRVAEAEAIDVGYHRGGELLVARGPHQVPAIEEAYPRTRRSGSPTATGCSMPRRSPSACGSPVRSAG